MSESDDILDPTPEELAAAEALRTALEKGSAFSGSGSDDADFLRSLKAAHDPQPIDAKAHDAIIERALFRGEKPAKREGVVIRVAFAAAAIFAVAAALLVMFGKLPGTQRAPTEKPELARVRSTAPLFDHPFDSKDASGRVDRIAMARASDLRENRFTQWGVR